MTENEQPKTTQTEFSGATLASELEGIANQANSKNLEALRRGLRGNDEAVIEIGADTERAQLLGVLQNPANHSREELLEATFANYSGEAYGDVQWNKKSGGWGSDPEIATAYGVLRDTHPEFAALSLDPGFMTHLTEFMAMLERGEIHATDSLGARNELKTKLGKRTLWRGTMLTDEEFQEVQDHGLPSPLANYAADSEQPQDQFEATALSSFPSDAIEKHFHGEHRTTPYLSVSEYEDVAIAVGRHFGSRETGKKLYLFKLSIPEIDIVSYTDHAIRTPSKLRDLQDRNPDYAVSVGVNGSKTEHKWDASVESFVFWKIDPEDIIEVQQPEISESSWNNRVTPAG